jgi:hypothetical protein
MPYAPRRRYRNRRRRRRRRRRRTGGGGGMSCININDAVLQFPFDHISSSL